MAQTESRRKNLLTQDSLTQDGYLNVMGKLGLNQENLSASSSYSYGNLLTRNRVLLEQIYRTSWIAGKVVDSIAEDMTKEGIEMFSKMSPDDIQNLQSKMSEMNIWGKLCETIKWSRLYGSAIAVILIEGADYTTPLRPETIGKNKFKGLAVFDRWQLQPPIDDLIQEIGPNMGQPKYYTVLPSIGVMRETKIHYSRVIRLDGIMMPYFQKFVDNFWGISVIERMYDRLIAFDSSSTGAAQLLYKAFLRVVQIDGLRQALSMGGKQEQAVIKQFQYIRLMQSIEGITLLDSKDTFTTHNYAFSGISEILIQFGQQISGSTEIPLVRLFGQSPAGLSATGESDLKNYYDSIKKRQETDLRQGLEKILSVMSWSEIGKALPEDFEFAFINLWMMNDQEKATISSQNTSAIGQAFQMGLITKKIAMKELAKQSRSTGIFTNITDEDIENAQEDNPFGMPDENEELPPEDSVQPKTIEDLEKELEILGVKNPNTKSISDLERELKQLKSLKSIEELEKDLRSLNPTRSIEELERDLRSLNPINIEHLEEELEKLTPIQAGKSISDLEQDLKTLTKDSLWRKIKRFFDKNTTEYYQGIPLMIENPVGLVNSSPKHEQKLKKVEKRY